MVLSPPRSWAAFQELLYSFYLQHSDRSLLLATSLSFKYPLSILPFSLGASWYVLTLPWLYPLWGFSHSVLRGGSRSMRASYIPEDPELLLLAGLCWMHWRGSVCHKHVLSVLVVCLTLLNSVWNKDLQDAGQGLRVGFMAMIHKCSIFSVHSLLWWVSYRAHMEAIMKLEIREHRKFLFPGPI